MILRNVSAYKIIVKALSNSQQRLVDDKNKRIRYGEYESTVQRQIRTFFEYTTL